MCNEDPTKIKLHIVSQSNLRNIWRTSFTDVAITKNTFSVKCEEFYEIFYKHRGSIDPTMLKYWNQFQNFHNEYITRCLLSYYAHRLELEEP